MPGLNKTFNEYAYELRDAYDQMPKAVLAAIAYSFALLLCEDDFDAARGKVAKEWQQLHMQHIVPQAPCKTAARWIINEDE